MNTQLLVNASSSSASVSTDQDVVFQHMQEICDKYQAIKEQLQAAQQRCSLLQLENTQLRSTIAQLKSTSRPPLLQSPKRRKTEDSPRNLSSQPRLSLSSAANESHRSDALNQAIQDVSSSDQSRSEAEQDEEDDEDEDDVISATPVMQFSVKRERTKLLGSGLKDSTSHYPENRAKPLLASATQTISRDQLKCEDAAAPSAADVIHGSPLRDANRLVSSTVRRTSQAKAADRLDNGKSGFVDVKARRKLLSLSSAKSRSMKQSLLQFSPSTTTTTGKESDPDETYFDGHLSDAKSKKSLQKNLNFAQPSAGLPAPTGDKLFTFSTTLKPAITAIKLEPRSQLAPTDCGSLGGADSSSVFALPNETDEIVMVEESQQLCLVTSPPAVKDEGEQQEQQLEQQRVIRTEYKQPVSLRTNKEKEAQPGFMCPDCAPWFKYMGARLTDRDIQKRLDACSRHRRDVVRDLPATPEGFWVPYFEDTQPPQEKQQQQQQSGSPHSSQASFVDFRLRNRQQVLDESLNY